MEKEPYKPHRMGAHSDTWGCAGDDDPCYCNQPKEESLQKESEWERKLLDLVDNKEAGYMDFSELIREVLSTREKEIAEEVEEETLRWTYMTSNEREHEAERILSSIQNNAIK